MTAALSTAIAPTRDQIHRLQAECAKLPQLELQTDHFFADGMYCRRVTRAAGVLIVGKVHKREHFYVCASGAVEVRSEHGIRTLRAGDVIVSTPGTKRAVLALEDSVCMTVHRTEKTDLAEIEAELIEPDESALFGPDNRLLLGVAQ
jgi:mannose-6-phosphate isomerase-like protein (cupin superfamily)